MPEMWLGANLMFHLHRSKPTWLTHLLLLLLLHLQQLPLQQLQHRLLQRRRSRKSLKNLTMTWALVCLTNTANLTRFESNKLIQQKLSCVNFP